MKINKDDSDRSTWYDELEQISRIRLAVFGILSRDRVRYQRYNSVYSLWGNRTPILRFPLMEIPPPEIGKGDLLAPGMVAWFNNSAFPPSKESGFNLCLVAMDD
jgi:hypothetical protein